MKALVLKKISGKGPKELKVEFDRAPMEMEDPILAAGRTHIATASFPVSPAGLACTVELYLTLTGAVKAATSGPIPFTSTGVAQAVALTVTMPSPSTGQTYKVYLDILSGGVVLGTYQATDNVIIPVVGTPTVTWG